MDFQSFKRRDLQSLCKLNKLPANATNAAMAESLASLPTVEGLEELLANLDSELQGSPERSAMAKPNGARTSTRQRAVKEDVKCSNLGTRTRCRTRSKAVEGTDTRKTPATRTTRKRVSEQASIQKMDKDLQADFEADMEQSQVSECIIHPGGELQEVSEEVSGLSVEKEGQNEVNDGQEVTDVDDCEKNKEEDYVVNDVEAENSEVLNDSKVDFHSLGRKDLQNLCKKNKIPANMTNAAMADALDSLEFVEGVEELVNGDSQVPSSPLVSGITSSCVRRSRTTQKITKEEPRSSKLITKSCRASRRRLTEDTEQVKNDVSGTPAAPSTRRKAAEAGSALYQIQEKEDSEVHRSGIKAMEDMSIETSEVSVAAEFNSDVSNSLMQEAPIESALEDDNEKAYNVENSKESGALVSQVGENESGNNDHEKVGTTIQTDVPSLESIAVSESEGGYTVDAMSEKAESEATFQDDHFSGEVNVGSETEDSEATSQDDDHSSTEVNVFEATSQDDHLSKEVKVSETTSQDDDHSSTEVNVFEATSQDDHLSKEVKVSETTSQDDDHSSTEVNVFEATSQDDHLSKEVKVSETTSQDDHSSTEVNVFEATSQDDHLSKEVKVSETTSQGDQNLSMEVEFKSRHAEDEMSQKSDDQPGLEINVEGCNATTDPAAEDLISNKFNFEATTDLSLRQLKRLYKERLKAAKLASEMQNLSLKETEIPLTKVEEDLQDDIVKSGNDESSVVPQIVPEDEASKGHVDELEECADAETETETKLCNVDILLDNEVTSVDAVIGNINVIAACAPQFTPSKCSTGKTTKPMLTPTKSASKMHISAGRKSISDDNKENIDSSVKTDLGKIKTAVTESVDILSPLSMAKLKRDIKFLQQQSEKKKQALKSRSENLLLSP